MNIFDQVLSDIFGGKPAQKIEAKYEPVLLPVEQFIASSAEAEINSLFSHNLGGAIQDIQTGLDKIGVKGVDRTLVEAVIAVPLQNLSVKLASSLTPDSSQGQINTQGQTGQAASQGQAESVLPLTGGAGINNPFGLVGGQQ